MKEYLISLKSECTAEQIWNFICKVKPNTTRMEVIAITTPIFLVIIDENDLKKFENLPEINSIETNDRYGTFY